MSMSMTYIQLIQQCTFTIWGGGVTLNFYRFNNCHFRLHTLQQQNNQMPMTLIMAE